MAVDLLTALALLLVLEGILPFLNPAGMRRTLLQVAQLNDRSLRIAGLVAMLLGAGLLYLLRQ
ncbi:DUF2065 domain-containing protein [Alkalilimnicola ehrlichii]|uniref:DUF2065 domain-containing protein n=1 Tax=Alkalilimnicola ehrlichii TaxID=351052 RepID=A0A3E0X072_9GAMM|nr:DUF2065 domain-containing protein [Alkalilimnicola ehrlichii]RFA30467.1 DUF2065 domain-containing protein [Alkalilimnicola ehrlichii]RFA38019.1 DUF2065 domain-containing protein [Alkalilimnicola ehrlichii]